jgi:flagellar biogenesis protein FliO
MELAPVGRAVAALAAIALVLLGLQAVLRALSRRPLLPGSRGRIVRILETTALPGAATLHVVEIAGRRYVVGRGGGSLSLLCELPVEDPAAGPGPSRGASAAPLLPEACVTRSRDGPGVPESAQKPAV